jgi:hypothetical protein
MRALTFFRAVTDGRHPIFLVLPFDDALNADRGARVFDQVSLVFYGVLVAVTMAPSWRILQRAGLSPWWSLFSFVPMIGTIVILWLIAYRRWPNEK